MYIEPAAGINISVCIQVDPENDFERGMSLLWKAAPFILESASAGAGGIASRLCGSARRYIRRSGMADLPDHGFHGGPGHLKEFLDGFAEMVLACRRGPVREAILQAASPAPSPQGDVSPEFLQAERLRDRFTVFLQPFDGFVNNMLDSPVGLIDRGSTRTQRIELRATGHAAAVLFRLRRPWRRVARLKLQPCSD